MAKNNNLLFSKVLITLVLFTFFSCNKENEVEKAEALYSVNNKCLLIKTENFPIYTGQEQATQSGYTYQYNSHNQFILKKPYYITPEGENLYTQYTDSVLYLNGYPTEGFFRYSESYPSYFNYSAFPIKQEYLRHEKYSFTGTQLDSINFSIYDGKSNDFRYEGVTKYYYNNSKIDSSITINTNINNPEKYNLFKSFTQCTYNFKDNNLISVYEANWSITKDIGDENIHYSDTTFTTKTYSDYTNQNNPYNGLFFVYDLREKSLSNNVNNHFEEITTTSNGDTTRIHGINLNFENFNANNYPEVDNSVGKLYYR